MTNSVLSPTSTKHPWSSDAALRTTRTGESHLQVDEPTHASQNASRSERYSDHCSEGALQIATRICSSYPEQHRVFMLSGLTKKDTVGMTAFEVSMALAMMDQGRVLLVDAYPDHPFLGDLIQLRNKDAENGKLGPRGLAHVLASNASVDDLVLTGSFANLDFLTAGARIDPALFLSERCDSLLKHLRQQYAFVVIASAPVMNSPECMRLAIRCDALAAVVTAGKHSQKELRQLSGDLSTLSIPLLGVIFSGR